MYGLYAVVVLQGSTLGSGHYIAYVKIRPTEEKSLEKAGEYQNGDYDANYCKKGQWYFTSDTYIKPCTFEEVKKSKAYMLFYERLPYMVPTTVI